MVDPIVEEVRRIREEHAAQFNYDLDAIFADYKRIEVESGRPRVSLRRKKTITCENEGRHDDTVPSTSN
ncbi:MAG: hypothetical protein HY820_36300 [Acidobacteria bacterium]|nr:hypothetical protein [Acidobacteriota bacterium]